MQLTGSCSDLTSWDNVNGTCTYAINETTKEVTVTINGAGKFEGLSASGTKETIVISESFTCGDTFIDSRDSKEYATVQIGDQCWMAENLAYTTTECLSATWNDIVPFNACRTNGGSGWDQNEVLYQWAAAMDGSTTEGAQGLCPEGWHIPTDAEWTILTDTAGLSRDPYLFGGNTGFDLLYAGFRGTDFRGTDGSLRDVGSRGHWWSSSLFGSFAWIRHITVWNPEVTRSHSHAFGFSVRCLLGQ